MATAAEIEATNSKSQFEKEQKADCWRLENREAIEALNDFTVKSGVFASEYRAF